MDSAQSTCWTMIEHAARGEQAHRQAFARKYEPAIRAYLGARWRSTPRSALIDDATQVVFVECLKEGGVLANAAPDRSGGFRAFLYGTVRNVALRYETAESQRGREHPTTASALEEYPDDHTRLSLAFDRAWARQIMKDAAARMRERAVGLGDDAVERVELLRLRFEESLPIRTIAERWNRPPETIHREYAKARREFRDALMTVIRFHHPSRHDRARDECAHLLDLLS